MFISFISSILTYWEIIYNIYTDVMSSWPLQHLIKICPATQIPLLYYLYSLAYLQQPLKYLFTHFSYIVSCKHPYSCNVIYTTSPHKYVLIYFLFCCWLLVGCSCYFYIVLLIVWFFSELTVFACMNCLKIELILSSIKLKTVCQYFLNPRMEIPTTHNILLFRPMLCAIVLFFGAT